MAVFKVEKKTEPEFVEIDGAQYEIKIRNLDCLENSLAAVREGRGPKEVAQFVHALIPNLPADLLTDATIVLRIASHINNLMKDFKDALVPLGDRGSAGSNLDSAGPQADSEEQYD